MPALSPDIPVNKVSIHTIFPTFESRWQALTNKDPRAATAFLYCVKSTHIYCRPICTARLARRKNVVFYDTVDEAEQAGFRPCKRCKPRLPLHETHHAMIRRSCAILDESTESLPPLKDLAKSVGLTQWHFHRIFRRFAGITPRVYWEGRHNPDKQIKHNIDFDELLRKLDGYSGEDPVNNRGEVPRRRWSDNDLSALVDLESQPSSSNLESANTFDSNNNLTEGSKDEQHAKTLENPTFKTKPSPQPGQNNATVFDKPRLGSLPGGSDSQISTKNMQYNTHSDTPTPLSTSSTPFFDSVSPHQAQNRSSSANSRPNSSAGAYNRFSNNFLTGESSPNLASQSYASSPEFPVNKNGSLSLPSSGELPAFSPLGGAVASEPSNNNSSKQLAEQKRLLEELGFNIGDRDSLNDLESLDNLDSLDFSKLEHFQNNNQETTRPQSLGFAYNSFNRNIPTTGSKLATNNKSITSGNPLNRHSIHQKSHSLSTATSQISKCNSQVSKTSQLTKTQKNQQRATQRSIPAWPQSPVMLAQNSPSLFPQSPALNAQASPLCFPQSPNVGPFQSPSLNALQSPGLYALQSPSLAPVLEHSPPTSFKSEMFARQGTNQPLNAPSPISLSQTSPNLQGLSDNHQQQSPNLAGQAEKYVGNSGAGISSRAHQLHQHLYRQVQSVKAQKTPQTHKTINNGVNKKNGQLISGIPVTYSTSGNKNFGNTPQSASPNSISPGSSGSPVNGPQTAHAQQVWRRNSNNSIKSNSSPAVLPFGRKSVDVTNLPHLGAVSSAASTPSPSITHASNKNSVIQALINSIANKNSKNGVQSEMSDLDAWLNGSVLKNLEDLDKKNGDNQLKIKKEQVEFKRPSMVRSNSTPTWANKRNQAFDTNKMMSLDDLNAANGNQTNENTTMKNSAKDANGYDEMNNIVRPLDFLNGGNNVNKNTNDSLDTDMDKMDLYLNDFENFGDTINFGTNDNANYMGFPNTNNSNNALDNDTNLSDFDVNFSNVSEFNTLDGIVDDLSNFSNGTDTQSMNSDLTNFTSMSSNGNSLGNRGGKANDADIYDWGMNNVGNQNDVTGNFANSSRNMAEAGGFNNDKKVDDLFNMLFNKGNQSFSNGQQPNGNRAYNSISNPTSNLQLPTDARSNGIGFNNTNSFGNASTASGGNGNKELTLLQYQQIRQHLNPQIRAQLDQQFQISYKNQLIQKLKQQQQLRNLIQNYQEQQQQQQQQNANQSSEMQVDDENENSQFESFLIQ